MSVDWEKYSTPGETRARGTSPADRYGVVGLSAGPIREIKAPRLLVKHEPEPNNRGHSGVSGIAAHKSAARHALFEIANGWRILPSAAVENE